MGKFKSSTTVELFYCINNYMRFEDIFFKLVKEDLANLKTNKIFEDPLGNTETKKSPMDKFMKIEPSKPHGRVAIRGIDRKSQQQIPDAHKKTGNVVDTKVNDVNNKAAPTKQVNDAEAAQIKKKYNIKDTGGLGRSGVVLTKNQQGNYTLRKK